MLLWILYTRCLVAPMTTNRAVIAVVSEKTTIVFEASTPTRNSSMLPFL